MIKDWNFETYIPEKDIYTYGYKSSQIIKKFYENNKYISTFKELSNLGHK